MAPRSALILIEPSLIQSTVTSALERLGFGKILKVPSETEALETLRISGPIDLLLCDVRAERLEFLRTVAREHLIHGVVIIGEPLSGLCSPLYQLFTLNGLYVQCLHTGPATYERLNKLLTNFDLKCIKTPVLPTPRERPIDRDVIAAFHNGEMRAALQPKIDVSSGVIRGFEVLVRWQRADGEVLSPQFFLPTLRRRGLLDALLFELLDQAVSHLQAHSCVELELAFNLEPVQLAQPGFAARIEHLLKRLGVEPRRIIFELTESGALQAPEFSLDNLLHLRLLGCGLSLDDFGTGQSTLQRLLDLPFTELKLDASFLIGLEDDPRRQAVLANVLELGRALELPVVAEGVETEAQLMHLQRLRCERAQGFYLGQPMLGSELTHLLRRLGSKTGVQRFL